jgi:aminoglycoside 3-N-acetyltransferase
VPGFSATRRNGILAEFVRTTPGARRSGNPGASVAALGRQARWLTVAHPLDYGYGENSPLAKLVAARGRVLLVGAPCDTVTLVHHADHLACLPAKRVLRYEVPFAYGTGTRWRFTEEFDTTELIVAGLPENYIEQIVTDLVATGSGQQGLVSNAPSLLLEADEILRYAISWLEREGTCP